MMNHHPVRRLKFQQFQNLLKSDNIRCRESNLLWIVLAWSGMTHALKDVTKKRVDLIQLVFVPVD
jgi:hypothetical protein